MERNTKETLCKKKETKTKATKNVDFHYYVDDIKMYFVKTWHTASLLKNLNLFWNGQKVN